MTEFQERLSADLTRWATRDGPFLAVATSDLHGAVIGVSLRGRVTHDTLVATAQPIDPGATAVHGLRARDLRGAPSPAEALAGLADLTRGAEVIVFGLPFVRAALARTARGTGVELDTSRWRCAQSTVSAALHGAREGEMPRPMALVAALRDLGIPAPEGHGAAGTATRLRALVHTAAALREDAAHGLPEDLALESVHRAVARAAGVAYRST